MLLLYQLHNLLVDFLLGIGGTGKGSIAAKVLVRHGFHGYHVKVFAHAVTGNHGAG